RNSFWPLDCHLDPESPRKNVVKPAKTPCSENLFQKFHLDSTTAFRHHPQAGRRSCSCDATTAPKTARRGPTTPWWKVSAPRPDRDSGSSPISASSPTTRNDGGNAPSGFITAREELVHSRPSPATAPPPS